MWVELLAGTTNVLRFPTERRARPTLDLMRNLASDGHDVLAIAVAAGVDLASLDLRSVADAETAERIHTSLAGGGGPGATADALDSLLRPAVGAAIAATWSARDMALAAATAGQALARARATGEGWLAPLRQRAEALRLSAARLSIEAYALTEHAEGVARAVDCARRGEAWLPDPSNIATMAALTGAMELPGYKAAVRPVGARTRKARTAGAIIPPIDRPCA